jgi:hypothetical protein
MIIGAGRGCANISTEWNELRSPNYDWLNTLLSQPSIFDGRNLYDPGFVERLGLQCFALGRGRVEHAPNRAESAVIWVQLAPIIQKQNND